MRFDPETGLPDFEMLKIHVPFAKLIDGEVVTCSMMEYGQWMADNPKDRIIGQEMVGDRYRVSTVFLGVNHKCLMGVDHDEWFESMVFDRYGRDEQIGYCPAVYSERYSTLPEARQGHLAAVEHARQLLEELSSESGA